MIIEEIVNSGAFDEKGHWRPISGAVYAPVFQRPFHLKSFLKWLFGWGGFIWPRHLFYIGLAFITWNFLQVDFSQSAALSYGWIFGILIRNLVLMISVYGFYHIVLYMLKIRGTKAKYNPDWQEKGSKKFLFKDQVKDNMFRSLFSGVPIWTAWEVLYFYLASNNMIPVINYSSNPIWFIALFILIPFWRETHFYLIHRLIHWRPLMKHIHSVHHKNPNPGPWSGMSMHPIEHILYLSVVGIHFIIPSHPVHFLFNSQVTALTPAHAHTGFEGPIFKGLWPVGEYFHFLHHRQVACNYGSPTVPLDKWFGRYYNGIGKFKIK